MIPEGKKKKVFCQEFFYQFIYSRVSIHEGILAPFGMNLNTEHV